MSKTIIEFSSLVRIQDDFENSIKRICKFNWENMDISDRCTYKSRSEYIEIAIREFLHSLCVSYGMMK